eukprot:1950917-Amphidinium_carterae.1
MKTQWILGAAHCCILALRLFPRRVSSVIVGLKPFCALCTFWGNGALCCREETEWYPVEECTGLSANVSECLANSVNSNWLRPDSLYEVRLQQATALRTMRAVHHTTAKPFAT